MTDTLGDRVKLYERAARHQLPPNQCLFIRVDGRAFHTYTRGFNKPFDTDLMDAMDFAAKKTAEDMQGFKLGYIQSDEATFLLTDFDTHQTQGWFGYELNKVVSISASLFTAHFNRFMYADHPQLAATPATFDSRAFIVPVEDAANVFLWRYQDWVRNSIQMLARAHFSHKECHGKKQAELHDMLHDIGINWTDLTERERNGTFFVTGPTQNVNGAVTVGGTDYTRINSLIVGEINRGTQTPKQKAG